MALKVERHTYEGTVDGITPVEKQVYNKPVYGPRGQFTRMEDTMREALNGMAEYYGTTPSWVVRLAVKKFITFFERNTHVQVYFPEGRPTDGEGDSDG